MNGWLADSWAIVGGAALLGVAAGRGWARLRSSGARRRRAGKLAKVQALFDQEKLRCGTLEAELHAQQARCFELEQELEARESDWAQSSPAPFAFNAQTFQIERPLPVESVAEQHANRVNDLERQVRDLQDLLSKVTSRARSSRTRVRRPVTLVDEVEPNRTEPTS